MKELKTTISSVCVIGCGVAGKSIALAVAQAGYNVILRTRRGLKGFSDFSDYIHREELKKRLIIPSHELLSRVKWTTDLNDACTSTQIIIEAVPEDITLKQKLFKQLDKLCPRDTILVTNTSSLSVKNIFKFVSNKKRAIGIHFFNPAHIMKLVEIIKVPETSKDALETSLAFCKSLGKEPMVVPDTPGFIVNRILFPMLSEAIHALEDGIGTPEEIDNAMKLGTNVPIGPLALCDLIGLDTCLIILENLRKRTGQSKYEVPKLLKQMVKNGFLGRKSGKGFYEYKNIKR
jgi:3-hydroxybutyryl-CoA dehydrogenase